MPMYRHSSVRFGVVVYLSRLALASSHESVKQCPSPQNDIVKISECSNVCSLKEYYVSVVSPRVECPEACPVLAPCRDQTQAMCIAGRARRKLSCSVFGFCSHTDAAPKWRRQFFAGDDLNSSDMACSDFKPNDAPMLRNDSRAVRGWICAKCNVDFCVACNSSSTCQECASFYSLAPGAGECVPYITSVWNTLLFVYVGVVAILICFALSLFCRPSKGKRLCEIARHYRFTSRAIEGISTWQIGLGRFGKWRIYRFWEWHTKQPLGIGVRLFFNFFAFVILVAISVGMIHFGNHSTMDLNLIDSTSDLSVCHTSQSRKAKVLTSETLWPEYTWRMFMTNLMCYLWVLLLAAIFASYQAELCRLNREDCEDKCFAKRTLHLEGLPLDLTHASVLETHFERLLKDEGISKDPDDVVGASISYHFAAIEKEELREYVTKFNLGVDAKVKIKSYEDNHAPRSQQAQQKMQNDGLVGYTASFAELLERRAAAKDAEANLPPLFEKASLNGFLDGAFAGVDIRPKQYECKEVWEQEMNEQCCSGDAWIVFRTQKIAAKVAEFFERDEEKHSRFGRLLTGRSALRSNFRVRLDIRPPNALEIESRQHYHKEVDKVAKLRKVKGVAEFHGSYTSVVALDDPMNINWFNTGLTAGQILYRTKTVAWNFCKGLVFLALFFFPNFFYILSHAKGDTHATGGVFAQSSAAGVLVAVGYIIMGATIGLSTPALGCLTAELKDRINFQMVIIFSGSLLAINQTLASTWLKSATILNTELQGRMPTDEYAGALTLYNIMWPGQLVMPHIFEPIFQQILPRILRPRICETRSVPFSQTEESLRFPPVDLVWPYAELIINLSLVLCMFFRISSLSHQLLLRWSVILCLRYSYLAVVYTFATTRRKYCTGILFWSAWRFFQIPTGLLACTATYWGMRWFLGLRLPPLGVEGGETYYHDHQSHILLLIGTTLGFVWHGIVYQMAIYFELGEVLAWIIEHLPYCIAQNQAVVFQKIGVEESVKPGWKLAEYVEVQRNKDRAKKEINKLDVVALAGGSCIDASGDTTEGAPTHQLICQRGEIDSLTRTISMPLLKEVHSGSNGSSIDKEESLDWTYQQLQEEFGQFVGDHFNTNPWLVCVYNMLKEYKEEDTEASFFNLGVGRSLFVGDDRSKIFAELRAKLPKYLRKKLEHDEKQRKIAYWPPGSICSITKSISVEEAKLPR